MYAVVEHDSSYHRTTVYVYRHNSLIVEFVTDSVESAKIVLSLAGITDIR
jgi:hypothetical protein